MNEMEQVVQCGEAPSGEGGVRSFLCDVFLGVYGSMPTPHRGRDRMVSFLQKRARGRWTGVRTIQRQGLRIETDFAVDDVGWILYAHGCLDYLDERVIRN